MILSLLLAACTAADPVDVQVTDPQADTGAPLDTDTPDDTNTPDDTDGPDDTGDPDAGPCDRWFPVTHQGARWSYAFREEVSARGHWTDTASGPGADQGRSTWVVTRAAQEDGFPDYTQTYHYTCDEAGVALLSEHYDASTGYTSSSVYSPPLLVIPAALAPGDRVVSSASLHYVDSGGAPSDFGVSTEIEVVGAGQLTTPAGTYEAMQLSVDGLETWFVEGLGLVQTPATWLVGVEGL
ncbi:MAG: hypothetical protein JXX28_18030 [Deltaproteobacteria bacterium]|nr:hypothetical protein [Deltaproteobacteria bacterium]